MQISGILFESIETYQGHIDVVYTNIGDAMEVKIPQAYRDMYDSIISYFGNMSPEFSFCDLVPMSHINKTCESYFVVKQGAFANGQVVLDLFIDYDIDAPGPLHPLSPSLLPTPNFDPLVVPPAWYMCSDQDTVEIVDFFDHLVPRTFFQFRSKVYADHDPKKAQEKQQEANKKKVGRLSKTSGEPVVTTTNLAARASKIAKEDLVLKIPPGIFKDNINPLIGQRTQKKSVNGRTTVRGMVSEMVGKKFIILWEDGTKDFNLSRQDAG